MTMPTSRDLFLYLFIWFNQNAYFYGNVNKS